MLTIIVLLILAGVALSLALGQNGLIFKARTSKQAQEIAQEKDRIMTAYGASFAHKDGKYDKDKFRAEIDKVKTRALTKFNFNIKSNDKIDEIQDLKGRQYNDKYQFGAIVDEKLENRNV